MKKYLPVLVLLLLGCSAPERSMDTLIDEGYTNIDIGGYAMWGCTDSSTFHTSFTAEREGHPVSGAVCCTFSSCEVRMYR